METQSYKETLFESAKLVLRRVGNSRKSGLIFITFCPWRHTPKTSDLGWGEAYLAKQGIDALHVITGENNWFQDDAMWRVIEIINGITKDYDRVITYGSSMGGFGAVNFTKVLNAHYAISVVPQYSIDRRKVPFESRWANEASKLIFDLDLLGSAEDRNCRSFLLFDPLHKADKQHVELINRCRSCELVKLPLIGHEGAGADILKIVTQRAIAGEYDKIKPDAAHAYRLRKKERAHYYYHMALQKRSISNHLKIDLLYRSVGIADDIVDAKKHLAQTLISEGRYSEAIGILNQQASRTSADGGLYFHLAVALERLQRLDEARAACEKAVVKSPKSYWAWNLLAYICICQADYTSARDCQEIAILLSPQHPDYHGQLARILVRLGQPGEACKAGKRSVDLNPASGLNWHWYALALESNGQLQEAVLAAQETVRYDDQPYYRKLLEELRQKAELG